ncbi:MAG: ParB/RepB/Spo0J family partition protein [Candidatus Omnitrophota bacterium]
MEKRKALGKGLQALISDSDVLGSRGDDVDYLRRRQKELTGEPSEAVLDGVEKVDSVFYIDTSMITPGKYQPRTEFNEAKLQELIDSIKEQGVVQPVLVRELSSGYELIAGERRFRAVQALGIEKIPAIVKQVDDAGAMEMALIENIQRDDLNPIEEARAYKRLCDDFGFSQMRVAKSVGKDRSTIAQFLRLLNLSLTIQRFVLDGIITMGHAKALLTVSDTNKQMQICEIAIKKSLSVRETEFLARKLRPVSEQVTKKASAGKDPYVVAAEDELQKVLGARVLIQHKQKRGTLVIEYLSPSDLNRIIDIIKG